MSAIRRMAVEVRTVPLVFKLSTALLIVAVAIGQLTQHRPAGRVSLAMLAIVTSRCPAALPHEAGPTVLNSELAADRAMRWAIADRVVVNAWSVSPPSSRNFAPILNARQCSLVQVNERQVWGSCWQPGGVHFWVIEAAT